MNAHFWNDQIVLTVYAGPLECNSVLAFYFKRNVWTETNKCDWFIYKDNKSYAFSAVHFDCNRIYVYIVKINIHNFELRARCIEAAIPCPNFKYWSTPQASTQRQAVLDFPMGSEESFKKSFIFSWHLLCKRLAIKYLCLN